MQVGRRVAYGNLDDFLQRFLSAINRDRYNLYNVYSKTFNNVFLTVWSIKGINKNELFIGRISANLRTEITVISATESGVFFGAKLRKKKELTACVSLHSNN